jgi:glucose-6-phosphate 1-dehydrogenase
MSDEYQAAPPCALAIFGATGDLTRRLIVPALCNLARMKVLPDQFDLIGIAYDDYDTESFRRTLGERVAEVTPDLVDTPEWRRIAERLQYVRGEFDDPDTY